jgi:hypothetical protein
MGLDQHWLGNPGEGSLQHINPGRCPPLAARVRQKYIEGHSNRKAWEHNSSNCGQVAPESYELQSYLPKGRGTWKTKPNHRRLRAPALYTAWVNWVSTLSPHILFNYVWTFLIKCHKSLHGSLPWYIWSDEIQVIHVPRNQMLYGLS